MMPDQPYSTRYGLMTAEQAAARLLDKSCERLRFLEEVFAVVDNCGNGFSLPGCSANGLSAILQDIAFDTSSARDYYRGNDKKPGCMFEVLSITHQPVEPNGHE